MSAAGEAVSKDELVVEIAKQLAGLPDLPDDWRSLAVVFTFEGKFPSNFGYGYTGDGADDWEAISNESDALDDDVTALREELKADSGHAFTQVLFQLKRDSRELKFEFAYDEKRWQVKPDNLNQMIASLRP